MAQCSSSSEPNTKDPANAVFGATQQITTDEKTTHTTIQKDS